MSDHSLATGRTAVLEIPSVTSLWGERARRALYQLRRNIPAVVGLALFMSIVAMAIFAPWIAPHNPAAQDIEHRLAPPAWMEGGSSQFPLGTDHLGRDILSRIIYGSRVSLAVGAVAVTISGVLGVTLGLISGYFGGWTETIIMRLADVQLAFPFLLLAIAVIAVLGPGLTNMILILGLTGWVSYARLVRSEVLALREREFVQAAVIVGVPDRKIIFNHILPNVVGAVIVMATLEMGKVIIMEASLSFLGLGVQPPTPTWGGMLADGRQYLATQWWVATLPGLALMATSLGINLVGDWLRDCFDPRAKD